MALITGLAGVLGRFAGRLLNSSLGWATILLFGKVSGRKQTVLLVVALASPLWIVLPVGVALPDVGVFLVALVPLPSFVSRDVVRLAMLVAALILPLAVGAAGIYLTEASERKRGVSFVPGLLRGYPFTLLLAITIAFLAVVATVRKLHSLIRRWEDAHVAVIVKPGRYEEVLERLENALRHAGIEVHRTPAPSILSLPPKLLASAGGTGIGSLVPNRMMTLKAPDLEALVYPSDIGIGGTKERVALARAVIASSLTDAPAYLTSTAETQSIEDKLVAIAHTRESTSAEVARARLAAIDGELMKLTVPYEDWETAYRERLQVERDVLERSLTMPRRRTPFTFDEPAPNVAETALAVAAVALVGVDVLLLAMDRRRGRDR